MWTKGMIDGAGGDGTQDGSMHCAANKLRGCSQRYVFLLNVSPSCLLVICFLKNEAICLPMYGTNPKNSVNESVSLHTTVKDTLLAVLNSSWRELGINNETWRKLRLESKCKIHLHGSLHPPGWLRHDCCLCLAVQEARKYACCPSSFVSWVSCQVAFLELLHTWNLEATSRPTVLHPLQTPSTSTRSFVRD